ncbi:peroxiredoxin (alkyl hydroperoxide reductase subunit C) [Desulfuromusa kysingii]|uniref:Alkyl hydroperoxide reductase C n=1 Tax=Desulfuromusa kysingii TaxID=37625 RepID=A0A1H4C689_9BACT|nr:peroxiredoxin [Desulfuromusa kysingii]SEA55840.1 peroxiredoxin (alkyl hydroperoxide reductase subunit C) [Desulfuromusa kysingii]
MPCDTTKVIEDTEPIVAENQPKQEEKKMGSTLVMRRMPEFEMEAYDAATGHYTTISSEQLKGKWGVICFYPADFTFVCPTEIAAMNSQLDKLNELGVVVVPISGDTKFSHKRFVETEPLLEGLKLTMGADNTGNVARKFGVWIEQEGVALRGRFIINPDGVVVAEETVADSVGRSVMELIRQLEAWQHAYSTGEVCPANWHKGKKTLPVNTDVEQMTGNVGKYITIDEILA